MLLRPPAHRGPLIAAGAVLVTVSVALVDTRFGEDWSTFALFALNGAFALAFLYLGLQTRPEGGAPPAFQSVLLLAGLALGIFALLRLADLLGSEGLSAGTLTWVLLAFGAIALWAGTRKRSAAAGFVAALAFGGALLSGWQWLFDPETVTPFRWLLLLIAITYVMVSLVLRGSSLRHSELLVTAAGLAILAIAALSAVGLLIPFASSEPLPGFWELIVVVAGCGLLAYAAADKAPGPAYTGIAVLLSFIGLAGQEDSLLWWPLLLGALGLLAVAAGLRPARPLPPQPDPTPAGDMPLAARSRGEETTIRVRNDT